MIATLSREVSGVGGGRERVDGAEGCLLRRALRVSGVCAARVESEDKMRTAPEMSPSDFFTSILLFRLFILDVSGTGAHCVGVLANRTMGGCGMLGA